LLYAEITIDDDIHGSYFSAKMRPDFTWAYFKKNEDITHIDRTDIYVENASVCNTKPR
jgi:hypothetical protein